MEVCGQRDLDGKNKARTSSTGYLDSASAWLVSEKLKYEGRIKRQMGRSKTRIVDMQSNSSIVSMWYRAILL